MPGYLLRRTQQISTALFSEECAAHSLTAVQYATLSAVRTNPMTDATRLSNLVSLDRSTLGEVLERLEVKGLVVRTPSPDDKRIKLLNLTKEGQKKVAAVSRAVSKVQSRLLEPLTPEQRSKLIWLLTRITEAHAEIPPTRELAPVSESSGRRRM